MMNQYTTLTQEKLDSALSAALTPESAAELLVRTSNFRTLPDKLLAFGHGDAEEMKELLRRRLYDFHADPKERDSIRKCVNSWFSSVKGIDERNISRAYAIEICFILNLTLERADEFMRTVTSEGLHYRSCDEFIVSYALKQGLSYLQYLQLKERVEQCSAPNYASEDTGKGYTKVSHEAVLALSNEDELIQYMCDHANDFSTYRNTSYSYFTGMMNALQNEGTDITTEDLVDDNLYRKLIKKHGRMTEVEKVIQSGWPEKTQLSKMRSRVLPVSRKVLILLFLASYGGISVNEGSGGEPSVWENERDAETDDADFEAMLIQLNAMLTECGFSAIDPRAPFDWMILFCMATGDIFDLDERFEGILATLYGNDRQSAQTENVTLTSE